MEHRTRIEDDNELVEGTHSRETYFTEIRIHFAPTFTRSESIWFLSLWLYEKWNQEKNPATISQMKEQVKENIELISAEILQRIIEEFSRL